ncbi:MAG TPA: error-prone DNA polymerase [Verrucomicrobiae bacterium]|jgi:error-prone DNA polymerase|nr:error-prone DNA polymerase [Verrucomicrobiae bacterium]
MFIELHARSAFSFLRASSLPEQLAETAGALGLPAMAVCDRDGLYGAPRFAAAAQKAGVRPIIGAEVTLEDETVLPLLVENRRGYQNLCRMLTRAHLRSPKGKGRVRWDELPEFKEGLIALTGDEEGPVVTAVQRRKPSAAAAVSRLREVFGQQRLYVEIQRHLVRGEDKTNAALIALSRKFSLPLVATNGTLYAKPDGRQALDVFTCIRHHTHLDAAGRLLAANNERFLRDCPTMEALFRDVPEAISNTERLADRLGFSLEDLGYEFPRYPVAPGETMDGVLRAQTLAGARNRYHGDIPEKVAAQIKQELRIIETLGFAGYFLIVADLVKFCRENNVMAQGRGSAANSTVCFCLGITAVDPLKYHTLFERFLSEGRKGWPDIDIDLPSGDRRESVIQEVYQRYGKLGAAMTANVITYRGRSAAREIGKALNLSPDVLDRFSNLFANGDFPHTLDLSAQLSQAGLPAGHPRARAFGELYAQMYALPRHLGQHSGGMIICQAKLDSVVPLENASMPGRVVAQWDKDDCEDLGIIKVDLLGLGMMSLLQDAIELTRRRGHPVDLAQIPKDDEATYKMMQEADTIGVFQIESRAQMATLPRMKPKCFYDLVIEVALIRPGPIQGRMVHPYLARRAGRETVNYLDDRLRPVLERTLGVPLFQEQLLQIAMVMADFSGSEAEELRRALSFHRSEERMNRVAAKMRANMEKKGVTPEVVEQIVQSVTSFALYGFPESHAISFAILAYGSAWLKTHRAPEFYAALLNNQPMGFYAPATIVKDAKRHGVQIRPVCARRSERLCTIEEDGAVRLGFCIVGSLRSENIARLLSERRRKAFVSIDDFRWRTGLGQAELRALAEIGALNAFAAHRREALWQVEKKTTEDDLFAYARDQAVRDASPLTAMNTLERLRADYRSMGLTTGPHPMALIRPRLEGIWRAADLPRAAHGQIICIAGAVICRQRPGTAKGFVFISLEDETGVSNAIVLPKLFEERRLTITQESFLLIEGQVQNTENVVVVKARRIEPLCEPQLATAESHDFH